MAASLSFSCSTALSLNQVPPSFSCIPSWVLKRNSPHSWNRNTEVGTLEDRTMALTKFQLPLVSGVKRPCAILLTEVNPKVRISESEMGRPIGPQEFMCAQKEAVFLPVISRSSPSTVTPKAPWGCRATATSPEKPWASRGKSATARACAAACAALLASASSAETGTDSPVRRRPSPLKGTIPISGRPTAGSAAIEQGRQNLSDGGTVE
mmetsp:Transcript_55611/g.162578  ORF Transcript_55611/g.162578 Transcript_55611/m.162578 type:complete len:209 (+) Transcript_55611:428-1054(+)